MSDDLARRIAEQFGTIEADAPVDMNSQLREGDRLLTFSVGNYTSETIVSDQQLTLSHEDAATRIFAPIWVRMQHRLKLR